MAQTGYTPIQLYRSTTASAVPSASNLNPGELAININDADMALYAENASGTVKKIMNNPAGLTYPTADGTIGQVMATDGAGNVTFTSTLNITTVNATTVDTTNIEVTTLKAKDGTSAGSIADSTGVVTLASSVLTTTDINGGTIDGAVIGGSSAAAGTFTTVTASGDVTIADKIVHSGDTDTSIRFPAADTVTVETSGAERLRVDSSGNVGIGTSAPASRLTVADTTNSITPLTVDSGSGTDATRGIALNVSGNNYGRILVASGSGGAMAFWTGGINAAAERMRIDASGNLGLGVTPSAWSSSAKAFQFGTYGSLYQNASGYPELAFNTFQNTSNNYIYRNTDVAARYSQTNGQHQWFTAPSGTAGNAITFTQAMTLDADGDLGIGLTSPTERLHVSGNILATGNVTAYSDARLKTNVRTVPDALGLVQKMRGVFFDKEGAPSVGVIAQEMEQVLPEVVTDGEYKSVAYGNIVGVLIEAIKAQQAQIDELKTKLGM